jgi:hypothetical protein
MSVTDKTAKKQGQWRPGQSGNPAGRPKGARNKVSEKFLEALAEHFEAHGEAAIDRVFQERPHDYLKIVASVLPKRMELEDATPAKPLSEMTDDELYAIICQTESQLAELAAQSRAEGSSG